MTAHEVTFDDEPSPRVRAAHELIIDGFAVLPVQGKRPLVKWKDVGGTRDHGQLTRWAHEFPRHDGWAVSTGSGLVVLDIDPQNGGDESSLPGALPETLTATTPKGGRHYYYTDESRALRTTAGLWPGVDVRGEGGIVVAPTGGDRTWRNEGAPLALAPDWLVAALTAERGGAVGPTWQPDDHKRVGKPPRDFALGALKAACQEVRAAPDGDGNNTLNRQAYSVARYLPRDYLTRDEVERDLLTAALDIGMDRGKSVDTIRSGLDSSLKIQERAWTLDYSPTVTAAASTPEDLEERHYLRLHAEHRARLRFQADLTEARHGKHSQSRRLDGAAFFLDLPDKAPVLWGDGSDVLWMGGEPLMIAGDDGTGKSTLDHQLLACRLGLRDTLLGYSVAPAVGRVVYLAMDRPQQARRAGARLFPKALDGDRFRPALTDRLAVWSGPLPVDVLRSPEVLADWLIATFGDDISEVHADSLKDIHAGLSKDEIGSGINSAIQEVVARGIDWVTLHHQRKANGENKAPDKLSDVFGSRWLSAGHGSVLMLTKGGEADKDYIEMKQVKEPDNRVSPLLLKHDRVNGRTSVVVADLTAEAALGLAGQGGATALEVAARMYGKAARDVSAAEKKKVERTLTVMVAREEVRKVNAASGGAGGSKAARFFLVDGLADA